MLSKVKTCGLVGVDGYIIDVETDISNGIPSFEIVGLADTAVKEAKERVRAAIRNTGFEFPIRRITMNMAPANTKKEGSSYDLPIAIGILSAMGHIPKESLSECIFTGELSLDGTVRFARGVISKTVCAKENGIRSIFVPCTNAEEAAVVEGINVFPVKSLKQLIEHFSGKEVISQIKVDIRELFNKSHQYKLDFSDVKGQKMVKRALEIAASGAHNCLMIGSPGCGKTMLAKRIPSILPSMTFEEAVEVTKIYSVAGMLPPGISLITERPFRSPHHTVSNMSLVGGGRIPRPGEVSLAHYGVLFLDEFPEFNKNALEVLRQPLEDGHVTISRINASITYPCKTTLVAAANPCKCGNLFDEDKECTCTPRQVRNYMSRISGPLMDRIDLHIEVASMKFNELESESDEEPSEKIRERVNKTRKIQLERYKGLGIFCNSQLEPSMMKKYCQMDQDGKLLLKSVFDKLKFTARAYNRILKVARTIADMEESDNIFAQHIAEAVQYRCLDRTR